MTTTPDVWTGPVCVYCGRPTRYSVNDVYQCKGGCTPLPVGSEVDEPLPEEMVIDAVIVDTLLDELEATLEEQVAEPAPPEPEPIPEPEPEPVVATPRRRRTRKRAT